MIETTSRTYLTSVEFEQVRHAAETYREDLVVSLAGLVGLRPAEITRVRLGDLREYRRDGTPWYLLSVREDDEAGENRTAYVPRDVAHDLQKFANGDGIDPDTPIFDVSARRIQMLVSAVSDRTTTERLQSVSSRDLRQGFAYRLLVEEAIHPRVVQAIGGWNSLDSLASFFETPSDTDILDACTGVDERETAPTTTKTERRPADRQFVNRADDLVRCFEMLGEHLEDASTHSDVVTASCTALATCFAGVWFCDENGNPHERAGRATHSAATLRAALDETDALATLTRDEGDESTDIVVDKSREDALCVVAVQSADTVHGYLCVTDRAFDATSRRALVDVGRRVGRTLVAVERKQLLLADTGVELTMQSTAHESMLVAASSRLDCRFELEGVVPVASGSLLHFVTISGASVRDVLDVVGDAEQVQDARLVRDYGEEALVELVVSGPALAVTMVETGGSVRALTVEGGVARITGVFSGHADVRGIVDRFTTAFPDSHLHAKRDVDEPVQTTARVEHVVDEELTEKQRAVLRAAFLSGYFEWPRGSTAEELAASMDISSPTLHNHLRKAQQKVLAAVLSETS
ncbi:bacterio-opsin activator domain-containing protein [Halogranum rubrum]|nr:bacterio-opsin activator domain-containing protein [Halogranum salarium]